MSEPTTIRELANELLAMELPPDAIENAEAIILILDNRPQIRDDDYEWADTDRLVPDPAPSK